MRPPAFVLLVTVWGLFSGVNRRVDAKVSVTHKLVSDNALDTRRVQELTSINKAEVGSKTFALVDSYDCDSSMVTTVRKFFKANDDTFDTCVADSNYQLYPYTGIIPDATTITAFVNSNACMGIITAVVLLNMPPCILYDLAMRAACETILYYSVAMRHGIEAPSAEQFDELMTWRRNVNLAKAAGKPYDGKSKTYSEFTKYMGKAVTTSKVTVMDNFTVILDTEEADSIEMKDGKQPSFVSTNSSMDYFVGRVSAAENGVDDAPVTTASKTVTTVQSSDATTLAMTSTGLTLALLALVLAAFV
ncbi:Elicitin [Phytophthora palmivora]|uniref:Elicitin n=1 Tax=Phytophthora palmivora TaxID=4796 RepID=A0A2P4YIA8_9STRA|nr:Elicitin [Phytophthora palmivora]